MFVDPTSKGRTSARRVHRDTSPCPSPLHDGGNTGLRFYYLAIEDYTQGISFNGQAGHSWHNKTFYIQPSKGFNGNDATGGVAAYLDDFCDQQCVNTANPKKY